MNPRRSVVHALACAALLLTGASTAASAQGRSAASSPAPTKWNRYPRRVSFNEGWRFQKGDPKGAEQPGFADSAWRKLELPHDWAIEGPFDRAINPHEGALPYFGVAWYRKSFTLPKDAAGRFVSVEFDGAMSNAEVWLNGQKLGGRPYGYIGFHLDLTSHLNPPGQPNVMAVRLAPEPQSSRWYPGAGIYRNVWLDLTGPVHVARWGTYVTTPAVTDTEATVVIRTEIRAEGEGGPPAKVTLRTLILDPAGKTVAHTESAATVKGAATVEQKLMVSHAERWDIDSPRLYTAVSEVLEGRSLLDSYSTPFGIRTIAFDKVTGFSLNGRHLKMHGVCLHHDLGALGTAVNRRATERQLEIMKSLGVNAIRTSHNPPSPELLEFADRLGLMVMDEAFDMWHTPKVPNGLSKFFDQWSDTDLRDMLHRDRNHPSIVLYSIGNEIPEQHQADGWKIAKRLTEICHQEDPTRPTTAAFDRPDDAFKNKLAENVDVPGINYKPTRYTEFLKQHPDWMFVGTETASTVSSRGVYHLPLEKYSKHPSLQLTSYDIIAPQWATCPDAEFAAQDEFPQLLGEFVWTGFDYLGEPTPYFNNKAAQDTDWPARSSYFGIVDLAGFPKDRYYLYQSVWTTRPMVHVLPHWNWKGHEGQAIPVMAYSNAAQIELFLNGRSLGRKTRGSEPVSIPVGRNVSPSLTMATRYRLLWSVPFEPGTLKAVAYDKDGRQVAADEVRTAGEPARVTLKPDRDSIAADGSDLSFITVRIEDKDGNLCPMADNEVRFQVEGAGRLEAVDNGNAATLEPFRADHRKAFSGMALLIVRSERSKPGAIRVRASSEGLAAAETKVSTR